MKLRTFVWASLVVAAHVSVAAAAPQRAAIAGIFVHSGAGHRAAAALMLKRVLVDGWDLEKAGIEAASAGMVLDNDMAPVWWKFVRDTLKARGK